jgi:hypothetical protein
MIMVLSEPDAPKVCSHSLPTGSRRYSRLEVCVTGLGLLLWLGQAQWAGGAGPTFLPGRPTVTFSGQAAPAPSSAVCGLVFVAGPSGPQAVFTEKPPNAFFALEPGEDAQMTFPLAGLSGQIVATAEVTPLEPCDAEVLMSVDETNACRVRLQSDFAPLSVSVRGEGGRLTLRLKTTAGSKPAAVLWRNVRVAHAGGESLVSLSPGKGNVEVCPPPVLPPYRRAIELALIEWDWRMQDGLGTERQPATYPQAVERTLQRGDALLHDFEARGFRAPVPRVRWESVRQEWKELSSSRPTDDRPWEQLWRRAHQLRREIALSNPLLGAQPLVFIKQVPGMFSHQLTQTYGSCARPGGGVFLLESPGRSMACRRLSPDSLPLGSYQHLEVSPTGDRLLFAYCATASVPKDREEHLERFYHLYEMAADGSGLKQLTDGPYDDFAPRYRPGQGLLFVSTRRGGYHRCGRGPCAVYTLCVANPDGSNPQTVSWHETHEWDPAVLNDGRIVYTRWDYVDRHAVHYQQLWSVRPDGSGVRILYGNNTLNPVGVWEAQAVPGSDQIMATAAAHHAMTAGSIILIDPAGELDGLGPITRLTPDALFPESEAPVVQKPNGAWSEPVGLSTALVVPPEAARWPGHCYRSPCPLSEKHFLAAYSFDALVGEPTWNPANMFGLYLVDAFGNKELLYRDLNIASLWPRLLRSHAEAPQVSSLTDTGLQKEGLVFLQDVHVSWPPLPPDTIKRLRIVQVLPKSTPHANTPMVGIPNASPGRQVLGTVPVEADGSAYFRAPAGLPLAFQALDARGQAVQTMRSLTYLQPGEVLSCVGCHEPRTSAPPPSRVALALGRPPSAITPGPDGSQPLSYPRLVQPVLDRLCVRCHNPTNSEVKVVLTGAPQGQYTVSYNALAPRVPYSAWGGKSGDFRVVNSEPVSQPGFFGARGSKLMQMLLAGHSKVELTADDIERLATWMDANVLFYGTFEPADQARQLRGERIAGPRIQ